MDLEKYWRVLATEPEAFVFLSHWDFYDNGWFSLYDGDYAMLYDECGNLFQSASFKSILTLTDGSVALCKNIGMVASGVFIPNKRKEQPVLTAMISVFFLTDWP